MQEEWDEKSDPVNLRLMKEKVDLLWPVPKSKHHVILLFRVHCRVPCCAFYHSPFTMPGLGTECIDALGVPTGHGRNVALSNLA